MRLRPGAEHPRDRSVAWDDLHQRARAARLATAGVQNYDTTYHANRPKRSSSMRRARTCPSTFRRIRSGATIRAYSHKIFIDSDPAFTQLAIAKAEPCMRNSSSVSTAVHLRREHRHTGVADSDRRLYGTKPGSRLRGDRRGDVTPARSLHDRDDVADRELHRRRRQQGSGIRRSSTAVTDAALRVGDQRTAASAAHGWDTVDARRCRGRRVSIASSSSGQAEFASPSTPTW